MPDFSAIPRSNYIHGLEWCSERIPYPDRDIKGDTFPMTWAEDGEIYTSAGDPLWGETIDGLDMEKFSGGPTDYTITKVNHMNDYRGWGGNGPKPSGMICVDGVLYFAFQNMLGMRKPPFSLASQHGSDAHIVYSTSKGGLWAPSFAQSSPRPCSPGINSAGRPSSTSGRTMPMPATATSTPSPPTSGTTAATCAWAACPRTASSAARRGNGCAPSPRRRTGLEL